MIACREGITSDEHLNTRAARAYNDPGNVLVEMLGTI
jgi:hypothetical protein